MFKPSSLLAIFVEKFHIPAVIVFLGFGKLWLPQSIYLFILGSTVLLQGYYKECPLNRIVVWLRKRHQPDYQYAKEQTWVWRFYNRYGIWAGVFVFLFWITVSWVLSRTI